MEGQAGRLQEDVLEVHDVFVLGVEELPIVGGPLQAAFEDAQQFERHVLEFVPKQEMEGLEHEVLDV